MYAQVRENPKSHFKNYLTQTSNQENLLKSLPTSKNACLRFLILGLQI